MAARKKPAPALPALPFPETPAPVPAETAPAAPRERKPRAVHPRQPGSNASRRAAVRARRDERLTAAVTVALGEKTTDIPSLVAIGIHAIDDAAARGGDELERDTADGKPGNAVLFGVTAARAACPADYWERIGKAVAEKIRETYGEMYAVGQLRDDKRLIRARRNRRPDVSDMADDVRAQALRRFNAISEALGIPVPPEFAFDEDAYLAAVRATAETAGNPFPGARTPGRRGSRKGKASGDELHPAPAGKGAP